MSADLVLRNGRFTTFDRSNPTATAVAITAGVFTAVGRDSDVMRSAGPDTRIIDLAGRRVLPGLIDNHLHIIRGGLNYNMELRWDGVRSLADAMAMLKRVRVVGGFTAHQFVEKRLPTIEELNAVAPDTPVFLLHPPQPAFAPLWFGPLKAGDTRRFVANGYVHVIAQPRGSGKSEGRFGDEEWDHYDLRLCRRAVARGFAAPPPPAAVRHDIGR